MVEKIKEFCADHNGYKCTIDEFERVLGLSKNYVYRLDKHQPSAKIAKKIAAVLETTVEELIK